MVKRMHEIEKLADLMYCSPTIETIVGNLESFKEAAAYLISKGVRIPVRCEDCKHWDDGRCECNTNGLVREYTLFDDFCSYGERKEE